MSELYAGDHNRATLDRKARQARERRARDWERKEAHRVLDSMKVLELENVLKRASRGVKDEAGRTLRLKANVASMIRQLIFWEGKGEAQGAWIWKTADEWHQETGMTYRMLRLARDVAKSEGLLEYEERGSPGETRVYYQLNMTAVLHKVATSERKVAADWLDRHPRSKKRPEHIAKKRRWERVLEDLRAWGVAEVPESPGVDTGDRGLVDDPESGNPQPELRSDNLSTLVMPIGKGISRDLEEGNGLDPTVLPTTRKGSPNKLADHQESTSVDVVSQTTLPEGVNASPSDDTLTSETTDQEAEFNGPERNVPSPERCECLEQAMQACMHARRMPRSDEGIEPAGDVLGQHSAEEAAPSSAPSDDGEESRRRRLRLPAEHIIYLAQLMDGAKDNELYRFVRRHVEGETDGEGPFSVERVAAKARKLLDPGLPPDDVFDAVEAFLENEVERHGRVADDRGPSW